MNKIKKPKIIWKYVGDESPEKRIEAENHVEEVYDMIFTKVFEELRKKKAKQAKV